MKCATGIQPSPHNSPIYDWAKLLSMRRIKSRARVREKSAGRRDGTSASPRLAPPRAVAFPGPRLSPRTGLDRGKTPRPPSLDPARRRCPRPRMVQAHGAVFRPIFRASEIREKLNIVCRARAPERRCDRPPPRPIAARAVRCSSEKLRLKRQRDATSIVTLKYG